MVEATPGPNGGTELIGSYRYPGVQPFNDNDLQRQLFRGRDDEKYELLQLVLAERLVLLFARSGTGKSSLINAGLLEPLRSRGFVPMVVRVSGSEHDPLESLYDSLKVAADRACSHQGVEYEPSAPEWNKASLWHFFKTLEFWREDKLLSPVLIIDQFEELFTLYSASQRRQFIHELADLVRGTRPLGESNYSGPRLSETPPKVKVVLSLREDFYANLEELRGRIPAIYKSPFRLDPLTREQATRAIIEPAGLEGEGFSTPAFIWTDEALAMALDFLCERQLGEGRTELGREVEPFQLQLVCQYIEDLVRERGLTTVTADDLGGKGTLRRILANFYEDSLEKICTKFKLKGLRKKLEQLCEYGFITARGRRLLREESTILQADGVDQNVLGEMVQLRLIRKEPRIGDNYYELTHDTLIEPIHLSRQAREANERTTRNRRLTMGAVSVVILALIVGIAAWQERQALWEEWRQAEQAQQEAQRLGAEAAQQQAEAKLQQAQATRQGAEAKRQQAEAIQLQAQAMLQRARVLLEQAETSPAEPPTASKPGGAKATQAKADAQWAEQEAKKLQEEAEHLKAKAAQQQSEAKLGAMAALHDLMDLENDKAVRLAELSKAYRDFSETAGTALGADEAKEIQNKIALFDSGAKKFEALLERDHANTTSVCERFDLWRNYQPSRPGHYEEMYQSERMAQLENLRQNAALVDTQQNFVTAGNVVDKAPRGQAEQFGTGEKVYVFASISSPGREKLILQWKNDQGEVVDTKSFSVSKNLASGYRYWYFKRFTDPGAYEVLLYNKDNDLLCKSAFQIVG
ncbi:MAG: hypothetical protein H6905_02165 [Hyphomicrobiales bacterium]|nr:hypothetical protein [Hyphomicrobiales bacterium]